MMRLLILMFNDESWFLEVSFSEMKQVGRNSYIKKAPEYFSRIIHDYSDIKKGFVDWKVILEERLV